MREFKTFDVANKVTNNYLQLCYMCDDKHRCTTEESCRQCWADNGIETEGKVNETHDMINEYHA